MHLSSEAHAMLAGSEMFLVVCSRQSTMDVFLNDLKQAARLLVKTPVFSLAAIAALALGIGTSTAIFSVVNRVILNPFEYPDPERMVMFQNTYRQFPPTGSASPTEFNWWRQQAAAFQDVSAYFFSAANLTGESLPELVPTMRVSADFFRLCGARAVYGRTFSAADDAPNAPKTAVLAYGFWERRFGREPEVIGRRIILSGTLHEVIGIMGRDLSRGHISEQSMGSGDLQIRQVPDIYLPFQLDPNSRERGHYFNVAARLKPGVSFAAADEQLRASYQEYARTWPDVTPGAGFRVQLLQDAIVGPVRNSLLILSAAVAFVLLMACANVASLLLARAATRQREFAVRVAVGAARLRIVRQLLTESMLLSVAGGVCGVAAGYLGIRLLLGFSPGNIPRVGTDGSNVVLDWRVLGFAVALSILTGILFGVVPAFKSSRADLNTALKDDGNRTGAGLRQSKTRVVLVTFEVTLAVVLLIAAGLLIRTFVAIRHVDPGFDAHNVLTMRMLIAGPQFETQVGVTQMLEDGVRRIRALPGVEVAANGCCVPLVDRFFLSFQIAGRAEGVTSRTTSAWTVVSPGYFETFNIPVVRGRTFTDRDDSGPRAVVINEALARRFWQNTDPTNDRLIIDEGPPRQIIGVVKDVRDALTELPRPNIYTLPAHLDNRAVSLILPTSAWAWLIRTRVAPHSLSSAIENELRQASGGLPVARVRTMDEILSQAAAREKFSMLVLTVFGVAALLLAAVGVYGLMAYSVAQRTGEIAVRLALGAQSGRIRNMVVIQGLRPVVVGMVCGVAAAFVLTRLLGGMLFRVQPRDPFVFLVAPTVLFGVALVAVWLPAIRATRISPIRSLRCE